MLFNIDHDNGKQIVGWIMPNNPSISPRIRVTFGDEPKGVFGATQYRPLLKEQGLHDTGICGFVLDDKIVRGLAEVKDLSIFDDDTDLLLYRRRPAGQLLETKLLRIETQLLRSYAINDLLRSKFHMYYAGLELIAEETVISILAIPFTNSIYATGRIFIRAFEHQVRDRGFKSAILIRDPFEELAERLWVLKLAGSNRDAKFTLFLGKNVQGPARTLRDVDLFSPEALENALLNLDEDSKAILTNSLIRQLTSRGSFDTLDRFAVSAALDTLAEIDIVGLTSNLDGFTTLLNTVLKNDEGFEPITLQVSERVSELATLLRNIRDIDRLIAMDIELYNSITEAFHTVERRESELVGAETKSGAT